MTTTLSGRLHHRLTAAALAATLAGLALPADAQSLRVITDIWGGSPNGNPNGCTTYGPIPALQGFFNGGGFQAAGGNVACGYTGFSADRSAATGPLVATQTLAPVALDTGGSFGGQVAARATYGALGAESHGLLSGSAVNTSATSGAAAAFFTDVLSAGGGTSVAGTTGYVRYLFGIDGSLSTPAELALYHPGFAAVQVDYQHAGGSIFGIAGLQQQTAQTGFWYAANPLGQAWNFGVGTLSGSASFASSLEAITYGTPWTFELGLLAQTVGDAGASFLGTTHIVGAEFYDAGLHRLFDVSLRGASGTDYFATAAPVPEPETWALFACGLAVLAARRRRVGRPE